MSKVVNDMVKRKSSRKVSRLVAGALLISSTTCHVFASDELDSSLNISDYSIAKRVEEYSDKGVSVLKAIQNVVSGDKYNVVNTGVRYTNNGYKFENSLRFKCHKEEYAEFETLISAFVDNGMVEELLNLVNNSDAPYLDVEAFSYTGDVDPESNLEFIVESYAKILSFKNIDKVPFSDSSLKTINKLKKKGIEGLLCIGNPYEKAIYYLAKDGNKVICLESIPMNFVEKLLGGDSLKDDARDLIFSPNFSNILNDTDYEVSVVMTDTEKVHTYAYKSRFKYDTIIRVDNQMYLPTTKEARTVRYQAINSFTSGDTDELSNLVRKIDDLIK